jgi:ADP-heptose:LPS heptosyltransferase
VQRGAARTELTWFGVRKPFALMVPGSSKEHLNKRWPAENYGQLAMRLRRIGFMPVIVGTDEEKDAAFNIQRACPGALNLVNRTDFIQLVMLARQSHLAIGNDTGPMHIIAAANCPSLTLFSGDTDPDLCAPRGADTIVMKRKSLADLGVGEVWEMLQNWGRLDPHRPAPVAREPAAQRMAGG